MLPLSPVRFTVTALAAAFRRRRRVGQRLVFQQRRQAGSRLGVVTSSVSLIVVVTGAVLTASDS